MFKEELLRKAIKSLGKEVMELPFFFLREKEKNSNGVTDTDLDGFLFIKKKSGGFGENMWGVLRKRFRKYFRLRIEI